MRISQKENGFIMRNFLILFICEYKDVGRFSYLHKCTFKNFLSEEPLYEQLAQRG